MVEMIYIVSGYDNNGMRPIAAFTDAETASELIKRGVGVSSKVIPLNPNAEMLQNGGCAYRVTLFGKDAKDSMAWPTIEPPSEFVFGEMTMVLPGGTEAAAQCATAVIDAGTIDFAVDIARKRREQDKKNGNWRGI